MRVYVSQYGLCMDEFVWLYLYIYLCIYIQVCAVADRPTIDSSLYLSAASYGMHCVHHLFPTIDQSKLHLIIPVFKQTCQEFFVTDITNNANNTNSNTNNMKKDKKDNEVYKEEDVLRTKLFIQLRQITTFGGWWGMCCQVSNSCIMFSKSKYVNYCIFMYIGPPRKC